MLPGFSANCPKSCDIVSLIAHLTDKNSRATLSVLNENLLAVEKQLQQHRSAT